MFPFGKKNNNKSENSSVSFGLLFFAIFFVIAFWNFKNDISQIKLLPLSVSLIFLFLVLTNSKILNPLKNIWIKFGNLLGKIISPLVMGFIYFFIITPIGLFLKLFGKDLLKIKFNKKSTYWIKKTKNKTSMKKQF